MVLGGGLALLAVVAIWELCQGYAPYGLGDLIDVARGGGGEQARAVFEGGRFPRAQAGLLVGAALGMAGTLFQTATRNPLSEASTLGVNAGAFLAVVVAGIYGLDLTGLPRGGAAFAGGMVAAGLVFAIATTAGATPTRLVLTGTAVNYAFAAVAAFLLLMNEEQASGLFFWGQGSLNQVSGVKGLQFIPIVAVVGAAATAIGPRLDLLRLDDDSIRSLGVRPVRARLATIVAGVLLSAAAVAVAGPLSFVGLIAPHAVRRMGVVRHRFLLPCTAVWGAVLVLAADAAVQQVRGDTLFTELPAGIATALIGAPLLLILARGVAAGTLGAQAGTGGRAPRRREHRRIGPGVAIAGSLVLLAVIVVAALALGETKVPFDQAIAALWGSANDLDRTTVLEDRLPRVLVALLAGGALAVAGVVLQAVGRNPLAEPGLIGVSGGAAVGALGLLILFPAAPVSLVPLAAFAGALIALAVVLAAAWKGGLAPERLLLVGVAVAAFTVAITDLLVVLSGPSLASALVWLTGSTYARSMVDVGALAPWVLVIVPALWLAGRQMDLLALGDDAARALGMRLDRTRIALLLLGVLLAASAVATVGTIGFVGLIAPHLARSVVGNRHRLLIPLAAALGAGLVATADLVGRLINQPRGVPSGLVVALVGTPFFLALLWRNREAA
ncbi:siderophore ABC transporter permease CdtC [soil metagenome]